jgi:glycosyltransferase involved in cell wall biosynthesis
MINILFFWTGLPATGVVLSHFVSTLNQVTILTEKRKNFFDLDSYLDNIKYINETHFGSFINQILQSEIVFVSGWSSNFSRIILLVSIIFRKKIILMLDNYRKPGKRQVIGRIIFKLTLKQIVHSYLVPGQRSVELLKYYGVEEKYIFNGYYGSPEKLFYSEISYESRLKSFVFVGQLINRKSLIELIDGYKIYRKNGGDWGLIIAGEGILLDKLDFTVDYRGFVTPLELRKIYNEASAFCLFSKEEHWGTVVCEAAMCGLPLLLSDKVGSAPDLLDGNGFIIEDINAVEISKIFKKFADLDISTRCLMSNKSLKIASNYDSIATSKKITRLLDSIT